ncbi:MAG: VCBS repeat-containing protein [Planctomycetota bacterium]|nr:VCBS repeat-containing protein [Planctomycetota bacterium]
MVRRQILTRCVALLAAALAGCGGEPSDYAPGGLAAQALRAPRPRTDGSPRFRRVPGSESGLAFRNELRPENRYTYLTNGAGMAVGDYDADGLLDAYLISQDGANKLFRQVAPLQFEDVTAAAGEVDGGAAWGSGASFADVDGDGDLDLYVCNVEAKNLLYVNQGDGTFIEDAASFGLDLVAASTMAAFADYDCDGALDLYLLTNRALHAGWALTPEVLDGFRPPADTHRAAREMVPSSSAFAAPGAVGAGDEHFFTFRGRRYTAGQPDRLLRNVGGRFVDVTASAGIADRGMGLSATWFDYDDDGYLDLYVANDLETPDTLYQNQRDGTFRDVTREVVPHTAYYGMGSDAADVDGDGRLDLIVADMSMTTHEKAKVLMGDMDEERPVLMHSDPPQVMRNALLLNTGNGRFQEAAKLAGVASTDWTWSVLFGDLDNDGWSDLFATNGIARFDTDPDLKLRVAALWRQGQQQAAIQLIQNVGKVPEKNLALRNVGGSELRFAKTGADWGLDLEAVSHGAVLADFDGDGDLDVLVNNFEEPCALYENLSDGERGLIVRLRGQHSEGYGCGARVTAELPDGRRLVREMSLSRGYLSGQPPELHFGLGDAPAATLSVRWPSGHVTEPERVAAGSVAVITEPGAPPPLTRPSARPPSTLFEAAKAPPFIHREDGLDEYVAQPLLPAAVSRLGPALAASGRLVYVGGATGRPGALFTWREAPLERWDEILGPWGLAPDANCEDVGACWLDYDGDGDQDLIVTSGGAHRAAGDAELRDRLYRNDGHERFTRDEAALPDVRESAGCARAADFDGDGDVDLFIAGRLVPGAYPDAPPSRLYRNDGGRFVDVTAELAPTLQQAGMVTDARFADFDGDGRLDLLVAARWQPLRLLRYDGEKYMDATAAAGLADRPGWWRSLCILDVDGDGDLDAVAGNQGWNTKYKASANKPARLYFGDFDDDGKRDLVEAKYEGDRLLPVRGRSCSSGAMPMLKEKFPTYEGFAKSLLKDIYTEQKLQACGELVATELASGLLINDGAGRFTFTALPRLAQISPIHAMVQRGDLLVCAQNDFTPEPETGRHDGGAGLVLRIADGQLRVTPPSEHGINAPGDHRGLVLFDPLDMLLFARNSGALHAWRPTSR